MSKPTPVYSSTGKRGVPIPVPVLHVFIVEHANGAIRATCRCLWKAPEQTFEYVVARAQFDEHAEGASE